jgi:hypothetical protein
MTNLPTWQEIRDKYTRKTGLPARHSAFIQIGVQGFCIAEEVGSKQAEWYREMAAKALLNFLVENLDNTPPKC